METKKKGIFYGWWIVFACTLIMATFFTLLLSGLSLFVQPITDDLGMSRSAFATFSTIISILGMILSPFAGKIMATKNTRIYMTVFLLVGVAGYTCMSFVNNIVLLYILAVVIGFGQSFSSVIPIAIILTRWFVKKRSLAMSITYAGTSIGAMILSPIITKLIVDYGWRLAFRFLGLGMLVIVVPIVFFIIRNKPEDIGLKALGADEVSENGATASASPVATGLPLNELRKTPTFWVFAVGIFVTLLTMGALYHMPSHVVGIGLGAETAARFVSIYSLIAIGGKLIMGAVFDKFGTKAGIVLGAGCMALCFVFLLLAKSFALLLVVAVFYGLGSGLGTIFPPTLTSRICGTKYYGEVFGFINAMAGLSMAVNNPIMAATYDATGNYTAAWIFGIVAAVLGMVLLFIADNGSKKFRET